MQAITQSMYAIGVPAFALQAIKAVVVVFVILLYSEQFRSFVRKFSAPKTEAKP
jgi:predicted PurR-regulated permease PerM